MKLTANRFVKQADRGGQFSRLMRRCWPETVALNLLFYANYPIGDSV